MKKGSPSGYDAETGDKSADSESSLGEPHEQSSLYRIRRTQENHQFLCQDCGRRDCGRRQHAGTTQGAAAMGRGAMAAVAGSDGSDPVQELELRHAKALRRAVGDGASRQNESHQRGQEKERHPRRSHHRRPGALQSFAGLLCGPAAHPRTAPPAALSQPGGERSGGHEEQDGRVAHGNRRPLCEREVAPQEIFRHSAGRTRRGAAVGDRSAAPESRCTGNVREHAEAAFRELLADPELTQRVDQLMTIPAVGEITALTWALEVGDPQRFLCNSDAMSYCGLTAALKSSAGKQQRGPISKQRNRWLQTTLIEAAKLAPRWNPQLAALHARELERGHRNRATLAVARKLVAYLLAVDKSGQPFQVRAAAEAPTQKAA